MAPGVQQFGRYHLLKAISSSGGIAAVYLAQQHGAGGVVKPCVVKRMLPELARDDQHRTIFLEEARISALLNHPHIVQTFDFGEVDGVPYLAMELVDGHDLAHVAQRLAAIGQRMPLRSVVEIALQIADALSHAHNLMGLDGRGLNVVHRDVCPQNILISRQGIAKLSDFGIARHDARIVATLGLAGRGKPGYMAPEQAMGQVVDCRADLFSLGVLIAEMMGSGPVAPPGKAFNVLGIPARIRELCAERRDAPRTLVELALMMTSLDPQGRPSSAREVADELRGIVDQLPAKDSLPAFVDPLFRDSAFRTGVADPSSDETMREGQLPGKSISRDIASFLGGAVPAAKGPSLASAKTEHASEAAFLGSPVPHQRFVLGETDEPDSTIPEARTEPNAPVIPSLSFEGALPVVSAPAKPAPVKFGKAPAPAHAPAPEPRLGHGRRALGINAPEIDLEAAPAPEDSSFLDHGGVPAQGGGFMFGGSVPPVGASPPSISSSESDADFLQPAVNFLESAVGATQHQPAPDFPSFTGAPDPAPGFSLDAPFSSPPIGSKRGELDLPPAPAFPPLPPIPGSPASGPPPLANGWEGIAPGSGAEDAAPMELPSDALRPVQDTFGSLGLSSNVPLPGAPPPPAPFGAPPPAPALSIKQIAGAVGGGPPSGGVRIPKPLKGSAGKPGDDIRQFVEDAATEKRAKQAVKTTDIDTRVVGGFAAAYLFLVLFAFFTLRPDSEFEYEIDSPEGASAHSSPSDDSDTPSGDPSPPRTTAGGGGRKSGREVSGNGRIMVRSDPASAAVLLNGKDTGKLTPTQVTGLKVDTPYRISVKRQGFLSTPDVIVVKIPPAIEESQAYFTLEPVREIRLVTRPAGADVIFNGEKVAGETPLMLPPVRLGETAKVTINLDSYFPVTLDLAGDTTTATVTEVTLLPATPMDIMSEPEGALVYINGNQVGYTPLYAQMVPKDSFQVRFEKSGFKTVTQTVRGRAKPKIQVTLKELSLEALPLSREERITVRELMRTIAECKSGIESSKRQLKAAEANLARVQSQPHIFVDTIARAERAVDISRHRIEELTTRREQAQESLETLREAILTRIQEGKPPED